MKRSLLFDACLFVVLVLLAAGSRVAQVWLDLSLPNFQAVMAASLFAGFYFRSAVVALAVPLSAMMLSDLFLGGYNMEVMASVYACMCLGVAWRGFVRRKPGAVRVLTATVASSVVYYLVTNLADWHAFYPHTWAGLTRCYVVAIPFFRYELAGDLIFGAGLFGTYYLATAFAPREVETASAS